MTEPPELITIAIDFARNAHRGQVDDDGKPYINHPLQVFRLLEEITDDETILAAALLHDVIEDTEYTYEDLKKEFGTDVADLVNEMTHEGTNDHKGYYFPRLQSKNGILIKFADNLSNLSRMDSWNPRRVEHHLKKSKFWKSEL